MQHSEVVWEREITQIHQGKGGFPLNLSPAELFALAASCGVQKVGGAEDPQPL